MVQTQPLSEETIQRLAPDASAVQAARGLVRKKSFKNLGVSADGTWLLAQCQGSGKAPYEVSVDLVEPSAPVGRCTCPSRKFPCKHSLGLMLAYAADADSFKEREPSQELLAKREKKVKRVEKAAEGSKEPRKVNKSAQLKKAQAQRDGLDLLEKVLLDLVAGGQWFELSRLERLERQAKQLRDHYLPGAAIGLRTLIVVGAAECPEEERNQAASVVFSKLWTTIQRGRNYLDGKLAGEESQGEADAAMEEVLGHAWQLSELREKGYCRQDLHLLELAHEREDDGTREERIETSYLLDLKDGSVYRAVTYRPYKSLKFVAEQPSYTQSLRIKEAAVYPGFGSPRVRWEKNVEEAEPLTAAHLQAAYSLAAPNFGLVLAEYRNSMRSPFAVYTPAAYLLRCAAIGRIGDQVLLQDGDGNRVKASDLSPDHANVSCLARAAGSCRQPAVLVRLFSGSITSEIFAQPLAVVTPEVHLRLGV